MLGVHRARAMTERSRASQPRRSLVPSGSALDSKKCVAVPVCAGDGLGTRAGIGRAAYPAALSSRLRISFKYVLIVVSTNCGSISVKLLCCQHTCLPCRRSRAKPEQSCCSFERTPGACSSWLVILGEEGRHVVDHALSERRYLYTHH